MSEEPENTCPKCACEMEEGFILDATSDTSRVSQWVRGKPEMSWVGGVKEPPRNFIGGRPKDPAAIRPIRTYRCTKCGFLESYAK